MRLQRGANEEPMGIQWGAHEEPMRSKLGVHEPRMRSAVRGAFQHPLRAEAGSL